MALDIATMVNNLGNSLVGQGTSSLMNEIFHKQQVRHQQDFTDQQVEASNRMSRNNQTLALETWNKTSYPAQVAKMKEAGINPGLMYGGTGSGGTTNFGGSGTATAGQAAKSTEVQGMGLQMASQLALMKAQKENIEADTVNKKAEAGYTAGVKSTNTEAGTALAGAQKNQTEATTVGTIFENKIKEVESRIAKANESNRLGILNQEFNKIIADVELTQTEKIKAEADIVRMGIQNELSKNEMLKNNSEINLNNSKINEISNSISQKWQQIALEGMKVGLSAQEVGIRQKQVALNEIQNAFNTSTPQQIKQWQEIFTNMIGAMTGGAKNMAGAGMMLIP